MTRFVFFETPHALVQATAPLYADLAALRMRVALMKLALKYSPDQPRVPAGSPDGGRWTGAGSSDLMRVAANDRGESAVATDASMAPRRGRAYGDSVTLRAGDGTAFDAPPTADFQKVLDYGKSLKDMPLDQQKKKIGQAVGQYDVFDFQRHDGKFLHSYTNASNYGVGVLMNGAGYSWPETLAIGTGYGLLNSKPRFDLNRVVWWQRGYDDARNSRLPRHSN